MKNPFQIRLLLDILLFICVLQGWWFFALPLGMVGVFYYAYFFEIVIAGVAYSALFEAVPGSGYRAFTGVIGALVVFILITSTKKIFRLRE